jgi:poly-gamma-glutamate synthesis protein (capsule biosynthesis protein)
LGLLRVTAALFVVCGAGTLAPAQTSPPVIHFRDACTSGERVTIAAVGDLLFHFNLQQQALRPGASFARFFDEIAHVFRRADIVYGNLEGPAARGVAIGGREWRGPRPKGERDTDNRSYDRRFYAGGENNVLVFNFHPSVVADLRTGGFHVLSTANNHAADRGPLGIEKTIDELEAANLAFSGTRRRDENEDDRSWGTLIRAKDLTIAFIACTYSTNGMPDPHAQVLACFGRRGDTNATVLGEIRRLAAAPGVDAIVLTPHWGNEYQQQPTAQQRRLAREAIEAGATVVTGAHPHVLQPWEKHVAQDGREGLIAYSLGNFISGQLRTEQRSGAIALIEFTRGRDGRTRLTAAGYVPTWVNFGMPWRVVENTGTASAAALKLTQRLLPPANRVLSNAMAELPKDCGAAVATAAASPDTASTAARASDTTGSIAAPPTRTATPRIARRAKPRTPANDRPWWTEMD